jgi:glycosyltransferase involved in cell wall biosynthesis
MVQFPLISVLLPTYNVEKYIKEAVESICNQSYKNLDIIIVDDCSTDSTYNILVEYATRDKRIKLYKNKKNIGIVDGLNFALTQAKGEFIARMDGDDISYQYRIEHLYNFLALNPQIGLVGCQTETIDEEGNSLNFPKWPITEDKVYKGLKYKMSTVLHCWLARKEVYNVLCGYRMPKVEDYDFLLRMLSSGLRFTNLNECLYKVRIRNGNTASSQGLKQRLSAIYAWKLHNEKLKNETKLDSFSLENYNRATNFSHKSFINYQRSANYLNMAMANKKSRINMVFYIILSLLFSPWIQGQFLFNRLRLKRL